MRQVMHVFLTEHDANDLCSMIDPKFQPKVVTEEFEVEDEDIYLSTKLYFITALTAYIGK